MTESAETTSDAAPHPGLRYARWGGHALGVCLVFLAGLTLGEGQTGLFSAVKAAYFAVFGAFLTLRLEQLAPKYWKPAFVCHCILSAGFVFVMIGTVMFAYMAAAERGERLGVPGLEGTMIFLALLQPPVVLFQRRPDLLD